MRQLLESLRNLGFGAANLPSPPTDQIMLQVQNSIKPSYDAFLAAIDAAIVANVISQGNNMQLRAETLKAMYLNDALALFSTLPVERVDASNRQVMMASKMVKQSYMFIFDVTPTNAGLMNSISEFETIHAQLKDGGGNIQAIIPERQDLLDQWAAVDSAWKTLKTLLIASNPVAVLQLEQAKDVVVQEIEILSALFAIEDEETQPTFPWMYVAYGAMAAFLVACACGAVYIHWASRKKEDQNNGPSWNQA
ncbi:unnamed protein product [Effrenium voratum]|nr:unnamed protein product [Effrenium voratum]